MSYLFVIFGLILFVLWVFVELSQWNSIFGDRLSWIGNPLLKKIGLQGANPASEYVGRIAKVLARDGTIIRVELDGTSWEASATIPEWSPQLGEFVRVDGIDGLCLKISKEG